MHSSTSELLCAQTALAPMAGACYNAPQAASRVSAAGFGFTGPMAICIVPVFGAYHMTRIPYHHDRPYHMKDILVI